MPGRRRRLRDWVYSFGLDKADGAAWDVALLGGKGANLHELSALGLPVPPGFTIGTEACRAFLSGARVLPDAVKKEVFQALKALETKTGRTFGGAERPLLLAVRAGARVAMPGMMETVLNLGLNDGTVETLAREGGDARFAFGCYRRFIQMYGAAALGLEPHMFEEALEEMGAENTEELSEAELRGVAARFLALIEEETGQAFPHDPMKQLLGAVEAVFASWMSPRAGVFRAMHNIPEEWGAAVTVQAMVFGGHGADPAAGRYSTRHAATGAKAQVKDRPAAIVEMSARLERQFRDAQEVDFVNENGKLWLLRTRPAKRSGRAAMRMAVDMAGEGLISREEAVARIDPASLDALLHPTIDPSAERQLIGTGVPASPGAASGEIVFSSEEAEKRRTMGKRVILVRIETSPEDVHGMHAADGVLTTRGGTTSHAAVVARGLGKPCVTGAGAIRIDYAKGVMLAQGEEFKRGDVITIDGGLGQILKGVAPLVQPEFTGDFGTIMQWADDIRRMKVRSNADTPADARAARTFGAEGIGLCRTEHMFFGAERIAAMREMIMASDGAERRLALAKLLPMQKADFVELFEIMAGLPVTIRLLDPPLHEFLPKERSEQAEVAERMGMKLEKMLERINSLYEFNPMLGHRGCRLAVSYPEIPEMQTRAIFEAAIEAGRKTGRHVTPEIMVPLVSLVKELDFVKARIDAVAKQVMLENDVAIDYIVGTMIELPRACIRAGAIAEASEFFSFGTNDLTQTAFGISRDDAGAFLPAYRQKSIIDRDPFVTLDRIGVGELIKMAVDRGRAARPDIQLGICGEHGGEPESIRFFEETGLDYVSCSPYRVPVARLAAAQAHILNRVATSR
jgi:pyruvate, orthophosphate dikinase